MPGIEVQQSSWAVEIEEDDVTTLPLPSEVMVGNDTKVVTQFNFNKDKQKVKCVRTYKIEKKLVPKAIARRKNLDKFGLSKSDGQGPNPATTVVAEEIFMQVEKRQMLT